MAAAAGQRDQEGNLAAQPAEGDRSGEPGPRQAAARPDAPASALRLADPQAPLRRLHAGDGASASAASPQDVFAKVCELFVANSGRERTTAFVHGVGWTQHTIGSQYIRGGVDPAAAAGQHGPARRRRDGDARPRLDPGLERHPDAVRHAAGLHPDAPRPRATRISTRSSPPTRPTRASGATCAPTRSAC